MDATLRDINQGIAELKAALDAIREIRLPETRPPFMYYKEPGWRALTTLPGTHYLLLANIEILLSELCHQLDQKASAKYFADTKRRNVKPGYWSAGAIAEGVGDLAVKMGVLSAEEKNRLLAKRSWEQPYQIEDVKSDLAEQITFLDGLAARLKER